MLDSLELSGAPQRVATQCDSSGNEGCVFQCAGICCGQGMLSAENKPCHVFVAGIF